METENVLQSLTDGLLYLENQNCFMGNLTRLGIGTLWRCIASVVKPILPKKS